jgi:hypothetical protein
LLKRETLSKLDFTTGITTAEPGDKMPKVYAWEKCYRELLEETDPAKLPERLLIAERTILNRVQALDRTRTRQSVNELAWLQKAIERLAAIQVEVLKEIELKGKAAGA